MTKWRMYLLLLVGVPLVSKATPWEDIRIPSSSMTESIGGYANGCLAGAKKLPLQGQGYQVIRRQKERFYGHAETIEFIKRLSGQVQRTLGVNLLIGDLSLPQGGRFSSGHKSHQTGLDVDIWLRIADQKLSRIELAKPSAISVVHQQRYTINHENWRAEHFPIMKMAAKDDSVARIFVHPVIKRQLCTAEVSDRSWLRKLRPWWGHHAHFHVRLKCPAGDYHCRAQKAIPEGDGCGDELASWWPENRPEPTAYVKKKRRAVPIIPQLCVAMLREASF
ncbi:penicillin-insensitive murein endopeptidase [Vibrio profundum]